MLFKINGADPTHFVTLDGIPASTSNAAVVNISMEKKSDQKNTAATSRPLFHLTIQSRRVADVTIDICHDTSPGSIAQYVGLSHQRHPHEISGMIDRLKSLLSLFCAAYL
jgi:DNA repair exonuclease SbcCD nuclease subunit